MAFKSTGGPVKAIMWTLLFSVSIEYILGLCEGQYRMSTDKLQIAPHTIKHKQKTWHYFPLRVN